MSTGPAYTLRAFGELSTSELYAILRLRSAVFVVEQNCVYQDLDDRDQRSRHLTQFVGDTLVGYTRLLPAGIDFADASAIGRVVTSPAYRRQHLGRGLMAESIHRCNVLWPSVPIRLHAQTYLLDFYGGFGFVPTGTDYLEDGIPHQDMLLTAT